MIRHLYLHGFGSGAHSHKGLRLRDALARSGAELELLDLNVPSFERQTYSAILQSLDRRDDGGPPLRLIGSSMGGYLAARWAELNAARVERLLLLCPGFDLPSRWPLLLGEEEMLRWERQGVIDVEDAEGRRRPLHWEFVIDARDHPAFPEVRCPVRIVHGRRDEIVPIELSRRYADGRPHVTLVEVDDDHALAGSLVDIEREARLLFGLAPAATDGP